MAEGIKEPGTYAVTIVEAYYSDRPTNDCEEGMNAVIVGETAEGQRATYYASVNTNIITTGNNTGKNWAEITADLIKRLGAETPPELPNIVGAECEFVIDEREWKGKTSLQVKFINTGSRRLDDEEVARRLKAIYGDDFGAGEKKKKAPAKKKAEATEAPAVEGELVEESDGSGQLPF